MIKYIFLICINFCTSLINAQERKAVILFYDSSQVEGFGEIKKNKIIFRVSKDSEKSEWSFDIAKGITFTEGGYMETFEYVKLGKYLKPELLEVIDDGNVTLYKYHPSMFDKFFRLNLAQDAEDARTNPAGLTYDDKIKFFLKRPSEEFAVDFDGKSFEKSFSKYFSDCEALVNRIKGHKYTREDVPELVEFYNNYCGEDSDEE